MPPIVQNIILVVVLLAIVVPVIIYIVKQKKRGVRCIGCPHAGSCSKGCPSHDLSEEAEHKHGQSHCNGNCSGCSSCNSHNQDV